MKVLLQYLLLTGINTVEIHLAKKYIPYFPLKTLIVIASTLLTWGVYLEITVGGITLRPNSNRKLTFSYTGFGNSLVWPFYNRHAWCPLMWDLNYYTVMLGSGLLFSVTSNL